MKVICYSTKPFEREPLLQANRGKHELHFTDKMLNPDSVSLAKDFEAVSIFAGDDASAPVVDALKNVGIGYITIRAAGYDNVSLETAASADIKLANVPAYSPYAIAEHSIALLMALNRKIILANKQVHQNNFSVNNLIGFDLHRKTVGIIGTGIIGGVAARIFHGFGCSLIAYDIHPDPSLTDKFGLLYTSLDELCAHSDIVVIHSCLTPATKYLISKKNICLMKKGVMLINTARGAILNTSDAIAALEDGTIGGLGIDVYEYEKGIFFYDLSDKEQTDPLLSKLMSMPNVLITPHQAFATNEALKNIAETTIDNLDHWEKQDSSPNEINTTLVSYT